MTMQDNNNVTIDPQDYAEALAQVQKDLTNKHVSYSESALRNLAKGQASFSYAENFAKIVSSLRQSVGPNQSISPSMLITAAKQSNANGITIPNDYVANAIGYLNGIAQRQPAQ